MILQDAGLEGEDLLVRDFVELGLTRNEAKLYVAAFGRPALRAAEVAQLAGVTRTKAYDALRLLVDKGLFTEEPGRVARFKAADPAVVAQRLRAQTVSDQAELVENTRLLVADLFDRYYDAPTSSDPFDFVEVLRNCEAALARREAIAAGAHFEIVRARRLPPRGAGPVAADELWVRDQVRYRALYESGFLDDPDFRAHLRLREQQGAQIRFAPELTLGMCVVDRRTSVLSLNPTGVASGPGTWLVLDHPGLARQLTDAFEIAWGNAVPAAEVGGGSR